MKRNFHLAMVFAGLAGLNLAEYLLFHECVWIKPFFYLFAWGSYLIMIDGLNGMVWGESRLTDSPGAYARMLFVSIPWWLFFEALNFRLQNWRYGGLPNPNWLRWGGYALSFATVLPAVMETADYCFYFLQKIPDIKPNPQTSASSSVLRGLAWLKTPLARNISLAAGILFLYLPLRQPVKYFPLVWGAVFLLLEPWLAQEYPELSWLHGLSEGKPQRAYALMSSGLACGILWEFFNYWSGAKWIYTVPWPQGPRIFEMPTLGYLGFPPFALECASFWAAFQIFWRWCNGLLRASVLLMLTIFIAWTFWGIDQWTLMALASP